MKNIKSFLKYFFVNNPANSLITLVYLIFLTVILVRWDEDGDSLSWGLLGFFSFVFLFDLVAEIIDFIKLKKSGDL